MTAIMQRSSKLAHLAIPRTYQNICGPCLLQISRYGPAFRPRTRPYSTQPSDTQKPGEQKSNNKDANLGSKHSRAIGKPARGFEDLYQHGSALSFARISSQDDPAAPTKQTKLRKGHVPLTKEGKLVLNRLLDKFRTVIPPSQIDDVAKMINTFEKIGVPKEFQAIIDEAKAGTPLSMARAWKIIKTSGKMANSAIDDWIEEEEKNQKEGKEEEQTKKQDPNKDSKKPEDNKSPFGMMGQLDTTTILAGILGGYMISKLIYPGENTKEITFQEFKTTFLDKGLVEKLSVVNHSNVRVDLHREAVGRMYPDSPAQHKGFRYYFTIGSVEVFEQKLDEAQEDLKIPSSQRIPVKYVGKSPWFQMFFSFGPTLLFIGLIYLVSRRASGGGGGGTGGIFSMGRSKARKFNHESDIKIRFKDVAGMDEAKQEILEFVSFLKEPGQYQKLGAKIPRGALLSGPPGTGKTMLAKATAGESGVPFFSISGSEFVEIFVGVGASRVRDLFATARKSTPCIIFIDEIDAVGKSRAKSTGFGGNDEREGTLNQILTEMDGFNTTEQVVVLAGTNRPDVLDKALLRPGRFDRHISIDAPTMEGRKQIFKVHLKNIKTNEEVEHLTGRVAALTPGFSGADIANCVNEAALIAARLNATSVTLKHFEQAIERVIGGLEKRSLVLNPEEKRTVAYHEAGHAICGWYFKYADPLLKVSIIPRGSGALGYAQYLPPGDVHLMSANQLMDRMAMALGGRVSEEIHFDTVTSGASDDFNKVTRMATAMVTKWGMSSKMGYVYFDDSSRESQFQKPFSEHTAMEIDSEVRRIVDEALKQCRELLQEKKKEVGLIAEELLSKEVLGRDDMVRLLGKRPWGESKEFSKYFGGEDVGPPPPTPPPADINPPDPPPGSGGVAAIRRGDWERF